MTQVVLPAVPRSGPGAERARRAVAVFFALDGFGFASWVSRVPAARDALHLEPSRLGLLLLCLSGGSVVALPLSGPAVRHWGTARAGQCAVLLFCAGLAVLAGGLTAGWVPLAGAGLLLAGLGISTWDVAMNVEAAEVERRLARTLMSKFHAGYSLGTVAGALAGAAAAAAGVPLPAQLVGTALLVAPVALRVPRSFVVAGAPEVGPARRPGPTVLTGWREPRTLLIGLAVLAAAFAEGAANDWLSLSFVDGHRTSAQVGAVAFAVFVVGVTGVRLAGGPLVERAGRPGVLRLSAALAVGGLLLVVLSGSLALGLVGAALWGLGAGLGFPVGMSAAADDPAGSAVRVSVVSSIGYTAFLAGPPLIGFLADRVGVGHALLVVVAVLVAGVLPAGATAPAGSGRP